jgi:ribosome-associated protein
VREGSASTTIPAVREVEVRDDGIRLGQLLKLAGFVDAGGEVKALLDSGAVTVGGRPEDRRGRQLRPGDVVAVGTDKVRLVGRPG